MKRFMNLSTANTTKERIRKMKTNRRLFMALTCVLVMAEGLTGRPADGQTFTTLYSFTDYGTPRGGLIMDRNGNLCGTTQFGGDYAWGSVFKLSPPYTQNSETVLYSFSGGADGGAPYNGSLVMDKKGNLYGTTTFGGSGYGVVFKLDASGHETVLHAFTGGSDGANPYAGLVQDKHGNLFGTAPFGGSDGRGVVFKVDKKGVFSVYHTFLISDGANPTAGLIIDKRGNLYGTTTAGGNQGIVFMIDPMGNESVLYSFTGGSDGGVPFAGVYRDKNGTLYGTTRNGGDNGAGVVFKLDTTGHETVLHSFGTTNAGGAFADGTVIQDKQGNLYGTTFYGDLVYKVDPSGNYTIVKYRGADALGSTCGLILDKAGNLYGTAAGGGLYGNGIVFKITP